MAAGDRRQTFLRLTFLPWRCWQ